MMKKLIALFLFSSLTLFADDSSSKKEDDVVKVSEALGYMIGEQLHQNDMKLDIDQLVKALQTTATGKKSAMSKEECIAALSAYQQKVMTKQSDKNLKDAEKFLSENCKNKDVVEVEKGKLQYKIQKQGNGQQVQASSSPLIRYKGSLLDGTVFEATEEPLTLSLNETIKGFSQAVVGMKEGEIRTIYIHPELGYGKEGTLPPNSLLTFEVEVVKATKAKEPSKEVANQEKVVR